MSLEKDHPELFENPRANSGACGVALIVDIRGRYRKDIPEKALQALSRLEHRGGTVKVREEDGSYTDESDGSGVSFTFENDFIEEFVDRDKHLHPGEKALAATLFIPKRMEGVSSPLLAYQKHVTASLESAGLVPLGWRVVVTNPEVLGRGPRERAPHVVQCFFGRNGHADRATLNQALFKAEQRMRHQWTNGETEGDRVPTVVSVGEVLTYKGLATSKQLIQFYAEDLMHRLSRLRSSRAEVHRREATKTESTWGNVQPCDPMAENGENGGIAGNRNEVRRLENMYRARGERISILTPGRSDSGDFNDFLKFLVRHEGVPFLEALRSTVLPAWWERKDFTPEIREWFEEKRAELGPLSAWGEGPKLAIGGDGHIAAAVMDRMGYRMARLMETQDGLVAVVTEMGAVPFRPDEIVYTYQLRAGDMVAVDTENHKVLLPADINKLIIDSRNVREKGVRPRKPSLINLDTITEDLTLSHALEKKRLINHGWTKDDLEYVEKWLKGETEPRTAMGRDWASPAVSLKHPPLNEYARPIVASCTLPSPEAAGEAGAMDTTMIIGNPDLNRYKLVTPILTPAQLALIKNANQEGISLAKTIECVLAIESGDRGGDSVLGATLLAEKIDQLVAEAVEMVKQKQASIIILSDQKADGNGALPIPLSIIASAINEALINEGLQADISVESSEIKNRHDMIVLYQCGVSSICPTAIFEKARLLNIPPMNTVLKLREALMKGMQISGNTNFMGYRGAKLLEFVGFGPKLMRYFPGFVSKIGGIDLEDVYEDMLHRWQLGEQRTDLPPWEEARKLSKSVTKDDGPFQHLARTGDFQHYLDLVAEIKKQGYIHLSDLLEILPMGPPIELEEVISEDEILNLFLGIAHISFGAIGDQAHRALARFANKIFKRFAEKFGAGEKGFTSGSGEGGERPERCSGGSMEEDMSCDREIASARNGVTIFYVADGKVRRLTVKIHQGAKPDEEANVPPEKNEGLVSIARNAEPGTRLSSPVTNTDLLSIEEFPMMVTVLNEANPNAEIIFKIVSNTGNDTIVLGVLKSGNDEMLISGGEGGTASASLEAIRHTGHERELGLAEAHIGVIKDGFEDQISLSVDGGVMIDDDFMILNSMGGRRKFIGTAAMGALGCLLLRKCNIADGCKPGIATQRLDLQENFVSLGRFTKQNKELSEEEKIDEGVRRLENYFSALAHAIRIKCAALGAHSPEELLGRTTLLRQKKTGIPRLDKLDLSFLIERAHQPGDIGNRVKRKIERIATTRINEEMMKEVAHHLERGEKNIELHYEAENSDQAIGTRLAGEMVRNPETYKDASVTVRVTGTPGYGCFQLLHPRMKGVLEGFAGENFGAGMMHGVTIVARPPREKNGRDDGFSGIGNNGLLGASGGEAYLRLTDGGGERLCTRLCGTKAVVEGDVGTYFCRAMSKGVVVHFNGTIGEFPCCGMTGGKLITLASADELEEKVSHHGSVTVRRGLNSAEESEVKRLLQRQVEETGSTVAQTVLGNWNMFKNRWSVAEADKLNASSNTGVKFKVPGTREKKEALSGV